jgi:hypothetical protein
MKQQLLFTTLFSAIVQSSLGFNEYDIFCEVGGVREAHDCHYAIPNTGDPQTGINQFTLDHLLQDTLHSCVREVTRDDVDIQLMEAVVPEQGGRQLRVDAIPQERLLGTCSQCCCNKEVCMIQGLCGSTSNSCGSQSCNRRLAKTYTSTDSTDSGDLRVEEQAAESGDVDRVLSAKCTQSVRALATLFGWNNKCLGTDPSLVRCSVTKYDAVEL